MPSPEARLRDLERLVRRAPVSAQPAYAMIKEVPPDIRPGQPTDLGLFQDEAEAVHEARRALLGDLRFEHMERTIDKDLWRFVSRCHFEHGADFVKAFVTEHAQEPRDAVCFVPVEYLKVSAATDLLGIRLLPLSHPEIPSPRWRFQLDPPVASVLALPVKGTNYGRMANRARDTGRDVLRRLRIALREHRGINDHQLRFRLGEAYSFGGDSAGWAAPADIAYELEINKELVELALSQPVAHLALQQRTDVEQKADLALGWMERAWFAAEPLVALLYLFFALEALLGDSSEGLKAHGLAFRQAMLGEALSEGFAHPNETYFLYARVRSGAVHGENPPDVSWDIVHGFGMTVRWTLNHYLRYAADQGFKRRGKLLVSLDQHPRKPQLISWLRTNGGPEWEKYLHGFSGSASTRAVVDDNEPIKGSPTP